MGQGEEKICERLAAAMCGTKNSYPFCLLFLRNLRNLWIKGLFFPFSSFPFFHAIAFTHT